MRNSFNAAIFALFMVVPAVAQADMVESATDATTYMDKKVGNQLPPVDNTLSNAEVVQLEQTDMQVTMMVSGEDPNPFVSGSTSIYKEKTGSAAKRENE